MSDLQTGVTAVIPHYGDPGHAAALARQLLSQETGSPLQVVVVDDAAPRPMPAIAGAEVVRRAANGGFGAAANTGASRAAHDLLLVLNSDLTLPAGFLDDLVARARPLQPAVVAPTVVCGGRVTGGFRFPRARYQAVEWVSVLGRWRDRRWFKHAIGKLEPPGRGGLREVDWAAGEALVVPTEQFRAVGGFDEGFFMYAEETDLQRRLHDVGVTTFLVDTDPVLHVGAASSDPLRSRQWLTTSRLRYAAKWGHPRRLRAALWAATTLNLLINAGRRLRGRDVRPVGLARAEAALIRGSGAREVVQPDGAGLR